MNAFCVGCIVGLAVAPRVSTGEFSLPDACGHLLRGRDGVRVFFDGWHQRFVAAGPGARGPKRLAEVTIEIGHLRGQKSVGYANAGSDRPKRNPLPGARPANARNTAAVTDMENMLFHLSNHLGYEVAEKNLTLAI